MLSAHSFIRTASAGVMALAISCSPAPVKVIPFERDPGTGDYLCSASFTVVSPFGQERPYRLTSIHRSIGQRLEDYLPRTKGLRAERIPCGYYRVRFEPLDSAPRGDLAVTDSSVSEEILLSGARDTVVVVRAGKASLGSAASYVAQRVAVRLRNLPPLSGLVWCELAATAGGKPATQQGHVGEDGVVVFADTEEGRYILTVQTPQKVIAAVPLLIGAKHGNGNRPLMDVDIGRYLLGPAIPIGVPEEQVRMGR